MGKLKDTRSTASSSAPRHNQTPSGTAGTGSPWSSPWLFLDFYVPIDEGNVNDLDYLVII
jgi:hypothetical protein